MPCRMFLNGIYLFQQRLDGWTISRADADMMQMDGSARIDQHISSTLEDVPFRLFQLLPLGDLLQIRPPRFRTKNIPKRGGEHAIVPVRFAGIIDKKRPGQRSIFNIPARKKAGLKCYHHDLYVSPVEFLFMITQLRDVRSSRESAEVAMKHQQQPTSPVVFEKVGVSAAVPKVERYGRFSCQIAHGWLRGDGRTGRPVRRTVRPVSNMPRYFPYRSS
jgi:hypothetical protein